MWRRNSKDPLARLFLERYALHVLKRPRAGVVVGDVVEAHDGAVRAPGRLSELVAPPIELPPLSLAEAMGDVQGLSSEAVEREAGVSFLDGFLGALGLGGLQLNLNAHLANAGVRSICFRFTGAMRDSVDPFALERRLRSHAIDIEGSLLKDDHRYYVITAVARSDALAITALDGQARQVEVDLGLPADLASGQTGIKLRRSAGAEIIVDGPEPLAFGVELNELVLDRRRGRLGLAAVAHLVQVLDDEMGRPHSDIGGAEDEMMIAFLDEL